MFVMIEGELNVPQLKHFSHCFLYASLVLMCLHQLCMLYLQSMNVSKRLAFRAAETDMAEILVKSKSV
jgi:hypothetical protein